MVKIGKNTFEVPQPPGIKSFAFQQQVLPVLGRVVSAFLRVLEVAPGTAPGDAFEKLTEMDVLKVLPAVMPYVGEIFAAMPEGELEKITRTLLAGATSDKLPLFGSPGGDAFDAIMQGRTMDAWKLLWHALGVWYPDFFTLAATLSGGEKRETPSEKSPTT